MTGPITESDLKRFMTEKVGAFAGVEANTVNEETTFESLGLDSADAVVLAMEVEQFSGADMDVALFLRSATLGEALAEVASLLRQNGVMIDQAAEV